MEATNSTTTTIFEGSAQDFDVKPCVETVTDVPITTDVSANVAINRNVDARYLSELPGILGTLWFHAYFMRVDHRRNQWTRE
ncbi:hypothetical protein PVK06_008229 [Gossypium arboreum]|uniref:Uncharacterized protein n=1 Tax=Gossypium arboreum TaxID=29729 RepID=A0ABR0QJF9_GOSAR|nr:hypothetical protein PVK06_008229 [Gossypium arboreum]